ncbi:unnamed protein product [Periconia digitata]|uniref:Asl1-like glycosyl hydrolase catalytic domain-containing protein n=1 Tax=Periconia digitata TaxID=1303443 RepID=A0A9W4U5E9_9PLEO|nr:unnamed protein product [Periconia digitata]
MLTKTLLFALVGLSSLSEAAPMEKRASSKRGLGFKKGLQQRTDLFSSSSWGYSWEGRVDDKNVMYKLNGKEFVPMLHDNGDMFLNAWDGDVKGAIKAGAKNILSFNEPDECKENSGGTCIPVDVAAKAHIKHIQSIASANKNVRIGSPAVTNGPESDKGLAYLKTFMSKCQGCRIDFIAAHWYDEQGNLEKFKSHFTNMYKEINKDGGNRKIWVTEWAAPGGSQQFMKDAMSWMDTSNVIERYAYYNVEETLTANGALSALGKIYA